MPPLSFLKIHLNIILPSSLGLPSCLFSSAFPAKILYAPLLPPYALHARPTHSSRFYHPKNIWGRVKIITLLVTYFYPLPCYLVPPIPKNSPQLSILKHPHPQPTFLPQCKRPCFSPIQNNRKIIVTYILIFIFLDSKLEDKGFCTEWQKVFPDFNLFLIFS